MKQVKFRGVRVDNGKKVRGLWLASDRPKNAQRTAEGLVGCRLRNFIFVTVDKKITMIDC